MDYKASTSEVLHGDDFLLRTRSSMCTNTHHQLRCADSRKLLNVLVQLLMVDLAHSVEHFKEAVDVNVKSRLDQLGLHPIFSETAPK